MGIPLIRSYIHSKCTESDHVVFHVLTYATSLLPAVLYYCV